ncbi:MAG: tetratricopeptide repeat protein, partial [Chloroflexi bacterium]|nr:tetratricopeptide repeat protein [Chloroflexota bacterium]
MRLRLAWCWRLAAFLAITGAQPVAASPSPQQARFDAAVEVAKSAMLVDPDQVIVKTRQAQPILETLPDARSRAVGTATLLWLQAEALARLDDFEHAAPLAERALALARKSAPASVLEANILLTRGSIDGKQLRVADALTNLQNAHRLFRSLGNSRSEAVSLVYLADLYNDANDYSTALRYFSEALETYQADPGLAQSIYNNRAIVYQELGRFQQADDDFNHALNLIRKLKRASLEAHTLRNIARNALLAGKLAKADRAIAAARALPRQLNDDAAQLAAVAAQAALQHGRPQDAGKLIEEAFAGIDLTKTDLPFRSAHGIAIDVYRALGRPDRALAHLEAVKRLDDESTKLAIQTSTALMAARFDSANQEAKIARLRDAARLREARDALQRAHTERLIWLGGAGAASLLILGLLASQRAIRRSRDQVRAANADLAVTNTALGKALAAKTEFLATTSHEIRTPLNGILGMTQVMLTDRSLSPPTRDRLTVVQGAGLTMRALVDDILDVAKMETGNLTVEHAPFDLKAILSEASRMWEEQARGKGLAFTVDLDRCPGRVEGDAARVRQIAFNLLSNAVKFTACGSVTLSAEPAGEAVRIAVA